MVWAALVYAIVGTWMTHRIGRALIGLNFNQQRFEADFRFGLVRFREIPKVWRCTEANKTNCAISAPIRQRGDNWWLIMKRQKVLNSSP